MRIIFTHYLIVITFFCFAQHPSSEKVTVTIYRSESKEVDTFLNTSICKKSNLQNGLTGKVGGLNVATINKSYHSDRIVMRCGRGISDNPLPLLVVDGRLKALDLLSKINPDEIKEFTIIKPSDATAIYGSEGENGVIIITTKKGIQRKLAIKDFLDSKPVSGATVSFISPDKKDTLYFIANDSGIVLTDKLVSSGEYEVTVSAVGYSTIKQHFRNDYGAKGKNILLNREIITCDEAIVSVIACPRRICCGYTLYCKCSGITITGNSSKDIEKKETSLLKVYPNPVQRGNTFNFQFNNEDNSNKSIRLISMDGKGVYTQVIKTTKGHNSLQLRADSRWATGTYFIQLLCENGQVSASGKLVIQ